MRPFEYVEARDAAEAVATVSGNPHAVFLGGGTNLVDHLKLGVAEPEVVVDVSRLPLREVDTTEEGGLRIGANVANSDLAAHPLVRRQYPVLAEALLAGASGQLRNAATSGGNLLQRTRCFYFQDLTTPCNKREPGSGCAALEGHQRSHAVLGASDACVAVHPSDMAVAMAALDAVVVTRGPDGERRHPMAGFHRLPGDTPQHDTVLEHGELITAIELPPLPEVARSRYRKVRDRASYAFALVSAGVVFALDGREVTDVRIALGGVAHKPWRARVAEQQLLGGPADHDAFVAAMDAELEQAAPLPGNGFKVPLVRSTAVGVLRRLSGHETEVAS